MALCDMRPCNLHLPCDYNGTKQQGRKHLQTLSHGLYLHKGFGWSPGHVFITFTFTAALWIHVMLRLRKSYSALTANPAAVRLPVISLSSHTHMLPTLVHRKLKMGICARTQDKTQAMQTMQVPLHPKKQKKGTQTLFQCRNIRIISPSSSPPTHPAA
jgi:hypothetical protein